MMKKTNVILYLAAALIILGAAVSALAIGLGAQPKELFREGAYVLELNERGGDFGEREDNFGQRPGNFGESITEGKDSYSVSADIKNIEIDWVSGNVKVIRGEGEQIAFAESDPDGIADSDRLYYTVEGDTLKIECCRGGKVQIGINVEGGCGNKELVVNIPYGIDNLRVDTTSAGAEIDGVEVAKCLCADSTSGTINAKGIDCEEVILHSTSGEINFDGSAHKMDISATSGDARINGYDCGSVFMHSTSGDLRFDGSCSEIYMKSGSGKAYFNGSCLDFDADMSSGEVEALINSSFNEIDVETTSGDVSLKLPSNIGFRLEFETSSGDLDSELPLSKRGGEYIFNGGGAEISVDTTSGDLSVFSGTD